MQRYQQLVGLLQKLLDLLTGLKKIRENILRKETVTTVVVERRELVSTSLIIQKSFPKAASGIVDMCLSIRLRTCLQS
jgi:hypothetical protein